MSDHVRNNARISRTLLNAIQVIRNFFRSLWKDFNTRFQHIIADLKRLKELVRDYADQFHIQTYEADRLRLLNDVEEAQESRRREKKVFVNRWIEAPETAPDHEYYQSVRQEQYIATNRNTAEWILQHADVKPWLSSRVPKSSVLWIHAIAGAGKSVIASVIIDEIQQKNLALVAYIYCKHKDSTKNTFLSIAKALLSQLLSQYDRLMPFYYDSAVVSGEVSMATVKSAKNLLANLLQALPKTYLVIDGLDECEADQRKMTLDFLNEQVDACDQSDPGNIRLLVMSRNESDIKKGLAMSTAIRMVDDDTADDLKVYIEHRVKGLQATFGLSESDRSFIEKNISDRCDG